MSFLDIFKKKDKELRTIRTARTMEEMNKAVKEGYKVLVKEVEPSEEIKSKYAIVRDKKTGEIIRLGDFRAMMRMGKENYEVLVNWTYYYPYHFENPFAAYLIPPDIRRGEKVFIEDVIEDVVESLWNQGNVSRLQSCEAKWTGKKLKLLFDPQKDRVTFVG